MIKNLLKITSIILLFIGIFLTASGNPGGIVALVAGSIMDLQAHAMDTNERLLKLENKDGNESQKGS